MSAPASVPGSRAESQQLDGLGLHSSLGEDAVGANTLTIYDAMER